MPESAGLELEATEAVFTNACQVQGSIGCLSERNNSPYHACMAIYGVTLYSIVPIAFYLELQWETYCEIFVY